MGGGSDGQGVMEGGDSGGGGREGGSSGAGPLVFVPGRLGQSFTLGSFSFIAGVVVSWALAISEWGVVIVRGAPSLSMGVVVCGRGRYSWGWALSLVGTVGLRVLCCRWWVLGVVEGRPAVVWGW